AHKGADYKGSAGEDAGVPHFVGFGDDGGELGGETLDLFRFGGVEALVGLEGGGDAAEHAVDLGGGLAVEGFLELHTQLFDAAPELVLRFRALVRKDQKAGDEEHG